MAPFTILTHGNDSPAEGSVGPPAHAPAAAPPPGLKRRATSQQPARGVLDTAAMDEMPLPSVVLQLPDLKTSGGWSQRFRLPVTSGLYWVALALGALFAVWLLSSGKKPAKTSADEAPTWKQSTTEQSSSRRAPWQSTPVEASPQVPPWHSTDQPSQPAATNPPAQAPPQIEPQSPIVPPADTNQAPPAEAPYLPGGSDQSSQAFGEVRTARTNQTQWDGTSAPIPPGSAAPLGITSPVQP